MGKRHRHPFVLAGLALVAGLAGCTDPRADLPTRTRMDRIDLHLTQFRDREKDGSRRLAVMSSVMERQTRWHDEHFARDVRRLGDWSDRDVQRWRQRQPKYRAAAKDAFDGDLKLADETIPHLFY